ncbi:MAG: outer membrane protein transport protein [Hyphomicrobiaceae bacterium]|nr:outer membrane protein transport protein [Hyphomicrobiaceae bacterium]
MLGLAGAGSSVLAENASIVAFNPAGMTALEGTNVSLAASYWFLKSDPQLTSAATPGIPATAPPTDGGDDSLVDQLIPGFYATKQVNNNLWAGLSVSAPFAIVVDSDRDGANRFLSDNLDIKIFSASTSLAYAVTPTLSVGGSLNFEYGIFDIKTGLPLPPFTGSIKRKYTNFDVGYTLGATKKLGQHAKVGVSYRHGVNHEFDGTRNIAGIKVPSATDVDLPQLLTVSGETKVTEKVTLLGDVQWAEWSDNKQTLIVEPGGNTILARDWNDTWRFAIGMQYQYRPNLKLRAGFAYETSPIDANRRVPDAPLDTQIKYAVGANYVVSDSLSIDIGYQYADAGENNIRLSAADYGVDLNGKMPTEAHIVGIQFNKKLGMRQAYK